MNQILYMNNQKKRGGPLATKTILKIFAILCILFGIILIGQASYAMLTKKQAAGKNIPLVEVVQEGANLKLKITHDKIIDKITYSWEKNKEMVLQGKGRSQLEEVMY